MDEGYRQGLQDGVQLFGTVCRKQTDCMSCPVGAVKDARMTCEQFAAAFPDKMISLLSECSQILTYADEFNIRFPNSNLDVDFLSQHLCRRLVFEGRVDCPVRNNAVCHKCWLADYDMDIDDTPLLSDDSIKLSDIVNTDIF